MNNNDEDGDHRKDNAKFPFHIFILKYFILFISLIATSNKMHCSFYRDTTPPCMTPT